RLTKAGLLSLACVLVLLGSAQGATPTSTKLTLTAPFKGSLTTFNNSTFTACESTRIVVPAFFNFHSGHGGSRNSASAKSCSASAPNGTWAQNFSLSQSELVASFRLPYHAGRPTVYANITYNETG